MKKIIYLLTFLIILIPINISAKKIEVKLDKCVDGDTAWFIVNNKSTKFRFLAINTPESTNKIEPYGKEASKFTCNKLTKANKIEIEYDKNSEKTDKYNRHLAWIFIDGKLLQSELVKKGYAEVKYIYGDYKYLDELNKEQYQAKKNKLNIWSKNKTSSIDDLIEELLNNKIVIVILIVVFVLILIFNRKIRRKFISKSKRKIKKAIKNSLDI